MQQKKTRHRRTGSHGSAANLTPRSSPKTNHSVNISEAQTQTDPPLEDTLDMTGSDYFSMSRQTSGRRSDKSFSSFNSQCVCPGCPANVLKVVHDEDEDEDEVDLDNVEDHLDDLEKKATEMMNKDSSRRSSYNIVPDDNDIEDDSSSECTLESSLDDLDRTCLLYTSPSPRDRTRSRMPSSA